MTAAPPLPAARSRRGVKAAVKVAVSALVLAAVVKIVGADRVADAARRLDASAWAVALAAFLATHALAALKWRLFLSLAGGSVPVADVYRAYGAGLFANLCLPSMIGGDVLRAGLAMEAARRKEPVLLGSIVDRLSDFAGLGILAAAGLLALPAAAARAGGSGDDARRALIVVAAVGVAGLIVAAAALRSRPPRTWPTKLRFAFLRAALALRRMRARKAALVGAVLAAAALQAALLGVNVLLGRGMGFTPPFATWLFAWPVAKIVAMLPVSFGGFGVREAAFAGLCAKLGEDAGSATALSLAWQGVLIAGGLLGGLVWGALSRLRARDASARPAARGTA